MSGEITIAGLRLFALRSVLFLSCCSSLLWKFQLSTTHILPSSCLPTSFSQDMRHWMKSVSEAEGTIWGLCRLLCGVAQDRTRLKRLSSSSSSILYSSGSVWEEVHLCGSNSLNRGLWGITFCLRPRPVDVSISIFISFGVSISFLFL